MKKMKERKVSTIQRSTRSATRSPTRSLTRSLTRTRTRCPTRGFGIPDISMGIRGEMQESEFELSG